MVWVMLVTPTTLANPYTVEEVCAFLARDTLMPVFVRVRLGDFAAAANACCRGLVVQREHLWPVGEVRGVSLDGLGQHGGAPKEGC